MENCQLFGNLRGNEILPGCQELTELDEHAAGLLHPRPHAAPDLAVRERCRFRAPQAELAPEPVPHRYAGDLSRAAGLAVPIADNGNGIAGARQAPPSSRAHEELEDDHSQHREHQSKHGHDDQHRVVGEVPGAAQRSADEGGNDEAGNRREQGLARRHPLRSENSASEPGEDDDEKQQTEQSEKRVHALTLGTARLPPQDGVQVESGSLRPKSLAFSAAYSSSSRSPRS